MLNRGAYFLAVQKKKTVKKTKKPSVETKKENQVPDSYFVTMMVGYLVLLAGIVLLLGCITISVGGEKNWLGLYFGGAYPNFMTFLFGSSRPSRRNEGVHLGRARLVATLSARYLWTCSCA